MKNFSKIKKILFFQKQKKLAKKKRMHRLI
uniref:Uncharacterized protein n=1 Tax=Siphoviridae sp. ctu9a31 TaxID=2825712 RepID=A0A8S5QA70_9CAUD|nr:MAG TPA: hypothetical protein [Siphoviridae sp. ctu9a31]